MDRRDLLKRLAIAGLAIPVGMVADRTLVPQLEPKAVDFTILPNNPHYHHAPMVRPVLTAQVAPAMIYGIRLLSAPTSASHHVGNFYGFNRDYGTIDYMTFVDPIVSEKGWLIEVFPR